MRQSSSQVLAPLSPLLRRCMCVALGSWICARACIRICGLRMDHLILHIRILAREMIVLSVALFDFSSSLLLERAACCVMDYLPAHRCHLFLLVTARLQQHNATRVRVIWPVEYIANARLLGSQGIRSTGNVAAFPCSSSRSCVSRHGTTAMYALRNRHDVPPESCAGPPPQRGQPPVMARAPPSTSTSTPTTRGRSALFCRDISCSCGG